MAVLVACPGCLITHHSTGIVREKEPRQEVQFESDEARQAFEARLADLKDQGEKPHKQRLLAVPFLLWWSREEVLAENAWYNDQLAVCDTNRDSRISLQEVLVYNPRFREGMENMAGWNAAQGHLKTNAPPAQANWASQQPSPDWTPPQDPPSWNQGQEPSPSMARAAYEQPWPAPPQAPAEYRR